MFCFVFLLLFLSGIRRSYAKLKIKNALMIIIMEPPKVSEVALCNQKGCYPILMENKTHIRMPKKTLPMLSSKKI